MAEIFQLQDGDEQRQRAVTVARSVWTALVAVHVGFIVACAWLLGGVAPLVGSTGAGEQDLWGPAWAMLAGVVVAYAIGHVWRMQTFKKHWRQSHIHPRGYVRGHLAMMGTLAAAALLAAVCGLWLRTSAASSAAVASTCLLLLGHLVNFPRTVAVIDPDAAAVERP